MLSPHESYDIGRRDMQESIASNGEVPILSTVMFAASQHVNSLLQDTVSDRERYAHYNYYIGGAVEACAEAYLERSEV